MSGYAVPNGIKVLRLEGTIVTIGGHYYVCERSLIKDEKGKWHTKSGTLIFSFPEGFSHFE